MSTEAASLGGLGDARFVAVLRFALGTTAAVAVAFGFAWPMGFLTPMLVAKLLGTPGFRPSLAGGAGMLGAIAVGLGLAIALPLNAYPAVQLLVVGLALFRIFHASASGASAFGVTMMLMGVTVLPLLVMESSALAVDFAGGFLLLGAAAMALAGIAHGLLPDPPGGAVPAEVAEHDPAPQVREALISTAVVLPLLLFVFALKLTSSVLVLAFVAIMAQQPGLRQGVRSGLALLVGNALGGLAALVGYELLVMAPTFGFLLALMLLVALHCGARLFGGDPRAPRWAMAFSTFLILLGGSTAPSGGEADVSFYGRMFQIFLSAIFIVGAFAALEPWVGGRPERDG
jgi:hypothetical protein